MEDFYEELLGYARQRKQQRQVGETPEPLKLNESRKQLQAHLDPPLAADLDQLLKRLSFLFYIRGYKDSASHQQTLGKAARPPKGRERFNEAVRNMLEQNIEMTDEQICTELDRLRVRFQIRTASGEGDRIGPGRGAWPWTASPIPDAVVEAIRRIRWDVEHKTYARQRQLLLGMQD